MIQYEQKQDGFTLVELVLSTAFFSFIMLFVVVGFVQINRSYTRGLTVKEIQNSAREVVDVIGGAIRDSQGGSISVQSDPTGRLRLCTGSVRFGWNMPNPSSPTLDFTTEAFAPPDQTEEITLVRRVDSAPCDDAIPKGGTGLTETLLEENMVVQYLNVQQIGTSDSYSIVIVVSTDARANPDDFSQRGINAACDIKTGDQFCDVARIETVVTARN